MLALLPAMRRLHELLWYLTEALKLDAARRLHVKLRAALAETAQLAEGSPDELLALDLDAHRERVNPLLQEASELARAGAGRRPDHRGANLIGRKLRGADLRGANLRGALLIGADLRDADLRRADFTGADLRGADLRGADLTGALFLTESQLRAAADHGRDRSPLGWVRRRELAQWSVPHAGVRPGLDRHRDRDRRSGRVRLLLSRPARAHPVAARKPRSGRRSTSVSPCSSDWACWSSAAGTRAPSISPAG